MAIITDKFYRQTIQDALGGDGVVVYGLNIFNTLIKDKEWVILAMVSPYFSFKDPEYNPSVIDIFSLITEEEIKKLKTSSNTFFMLNYCWEGTSYLDYNFWELLTGAAIKHGIPTEKIFFITSNLRDEEGYDRWQKTYYPDHRINVISLNYFSQYVAHKLQFSVSIDQTVSNIQGGQKFFLSLNRRLRPWRLYTIYKIFESRILKNTLISYDRIKPEFIDFREEFEYAVNKDVFAKLVASSPSVLDFSDFQKNWACEPCEAATPTPLFNKTLVSLVSETLFETDGGNALFYSEKTFKPMLYNHPIMVFGQDGLNTTLREVGFRDYSAYFDLSFDHIQNHVDRVNAQVVQLEILNDRLLSMTNDQKIEWLLQDRETLEYNKNALREQTFNKMKLQRIIDIVKAISE